VVEALKERDVVRIGFEAEPWLKPADRIVARFAQDSGGIYDPVRRQRSLERLRQSARGDSQPSPAEHIAANVRRLERLARYRLATCLPDGSWRIPSDLLSQLKTRERTHPRHRFRFDTLAGPPRAPVRPPAPDVAAEREALARVLSKELRLAYLAEPPAFRRRVMACAPTASGREYVQIVDYRTGSSR
jgi:hypothetical protein